MLIVHPTNEEFEGFLQDANRTGGTPRNARVVRHLLFGCSDCRDRLDAMGWNGQRLERLLQLPVRVRAAEEEDAAPAASGFNYDGAFAGAQRALDAFFAEGCKAEISPDQLLAELKALPADEQIRRVSRDSRFANPVLIKRLIDLSHAARYSSPEEMLQLAYLACLAAEACNDEAAGSEPKCADLRSHGWRQYGNALRLQGRIVEAEEAFASAHRYCLEGTGDPPLRAWLLEQMTSLRIFQRRFDDAIQLADDAGQIYRELEQTNSLASTLVQKAVAQLYAGEVEGAVRTLNRAIPLIDPSGDPHLLLAACHNLVRCYIDLDRPEQALSLYFEARSLYQEFEDALILLRSGWQEGQLLRDLGHLRAAESALLRAREGFGERELLYEVAVVSLDLAAVYIKLGDAERLKQTVAETVPIFRALGVDREALASLLQLQQMASQGRQAFELIRFLNSQLQQFSRKAA